MIRVDLLGLSFTYEGNEAKEKSASLDQGKIHLLCKVHFEVRTEIIFCSKNIPKSYAIFLLRMAGQGSKNIWEFSRDFWSNKNEGCFGAQVSKLSFREEIEYFLL